MVGAIQRLDILAHPFITIHCFGWRVFLRAISPRHQTTFLSLLQDAELFRGKGPELPPAIERCIDLELRAKRVYETLAAMFTQDPGEKGSVSRFFHRLAQQEQEHADLLEICRSAAIRGGWKTDQFHPWQDHVPLLEDEMGKAESAVSASMSVEDALQLVIHVECSEVNQVFEAIVQATDSPFVKRLRPFRDAMESHMNFICERIPRLAPSLTSVAREMCARFSERNYNRA